MVSIPCVALVALAEKVPSEHAIELIDRWITLGIKVECLNQYPKFK